MKKMKKVNQLEKRSIPNKKSNGHRKENSTLNVHHENLQVRAPPLKFHPLIAIMAESQSLSRTSI